jgi:hypothetical protein
MKAATNRKMNIDDRDYIESLGLDVSFLTANDVAHIMNDVVQAGTDFDYGRLPWHESEEEAASSACEATWQDIKSANGH